MKRLGLPRTAVVMKTLVPMSQAPCGYFFDVIKDIKTCRRLLFVAKLVSLLHV